MPDVQTGSKSSKRPWQNMYHTSKMQRRVYKTKLVVGEHVFGYITVNKKQLSDEQIKTYQEYYCGLCRKLKQDYGKRGQLVLNYDMTFLIVLLSGLYEPDDEKEGTVYMCSTSCAEAFIENKRHNRLCSSDEYSF